MNDNQEKLKRTFRDESLELLADLETSLLQLEQDPGDTESVSSIFRAFHTIKGSGAMLGFDEISEFTHEIEDVYDLVRSGKVVADKQLIDLTLSSCDLIKDMVEKGEPGEYQYRDQTSDLVAAFRMMIPELGERTQQGRITLPKSGLNPLLETLGGTSVTYRIRFRPHRELFLSGTNPLLLLGELQGFGECKIVAHTDEIPQLEDLDPEACYTTWDVVLTTEKSMDAIRDVFIFVEDQCELTIAVIDTGGHLDSADYKKLGEILVERREISQEDLEAALHHDQPLGEVLVSQGLVRQGAIQAALTEQEYVRQLRETRAKTEVISSIRVAAEKLDYLVNLVGELVTVQARLTQTAALRNDAELTSIAEEVERLTDELRDRTMSIRMLPIDTLFAKFNRLVRDLSSELHKEIDLITEGGDTELDKTIIEKLNDPLVHIIRNSIDHGIEPPEVRSGEGKVRKGTVHLSARHSGASVLIEIRDDGAGMDPEEIRAKAVEKGMLAPDADLPEEELFALILAPGFSTSKDVTSISGRGVGMDVVRRAVESLRGTIEISSMKGIGTTITLSLPLTLAIIEGLLVEIGNNYFVLPLSEVEECVELDSREAAQTRQHIAHVRGEIVPYIKLREQFAINGSTPEIEQIVIIANEGRRVGFVVDKVIGEHQTVIKTLGRIFKQVEGISGATILGDGTVALILDIARLVRIVEEQEVSRTG